jgi:hypothetical protein
MEIYFKEEERICLKWVYVSIHALLPGMLKGHHYLPVEVQAQKIDAISH